MAKVRSARGTLIDFDLIKIKQSMGADKEKPTTVATRTNFVENKMKRRLKKLKRDVVKKVNETVVDKKIEEKEEPIKE